MTYHFITAILLGSLIAASAGETPGSSAAPAETGFLNVDVSRSFLTYSGGMDFEDIDGSLNVIDFDFISMLSRPITVAGDVMLLPLVQYGLTDLDFDDVDAAFPIGDEELHSVSLHLAAVKLNQGSPWFYGGWGRAELASDFQHIDTDDFTFDIAGGVGYRFSDNFTLAAGAAVININGDTWVCPGINFDWIVNEQTRIGLYGPISRISYTPDENWSFSLRGNPGGGVWNITDDKGDSRSIDLSSYQVGAFAGRRLAGKLWLNAGVGITIFNGIEYSDPDGGNKTLDEDMESGMFGQIGLILRSW